MNIMNTFLMSAVIGIVAGIVDIIPMIVRKLPRYSIVSAFIHYFFVSIVIIQIDLPFLPWWLKGSVVALALSLPMLIQVGYTEDRKAVPVIAANAVILGFLIGLAGIWFC